MGFLSVLGNIGKGALHLATGNIPGLISDVGGVLGSAGAAAGAGRRSDADLQARMNIANNAAQLNAAKFNMDAPSARYGQVAKGDLVNNVQDVGETGSGRDLHFTGGLRPSALGPASKQAATEMQRQALAALMSGSDQLHPAMSSLPSSGILEKIGGVASSSSSTTNARCTGRSPRTSRTAISGSGKKGSMPNSA
jgi:hypothetical protein